MPTEHKYLYKATASKNGSCDPDKHSEKPETPELGQALRDAHALTSGNKVVTILRADTEGVNAGKFFLHQIIK